MATVNAITTNAKGRGVVSTPSGASAPRGRAGRRESIRIVNYSNIFDTSATMPPARAITNDTRLIDLTIGELLEVVIEQLRRTPLGAKSQAEPEALIDTWGAATLLGIVSKYDPGPEPPTGTPAWRT